MAAMLSTAEPAFESGPYPSYCLLDLVINPHSIEYSYRRNNVRFYVNVEERHLVGQGNLLADFYTFKAGLGDPDVMFDFEQWVLSCLDGVMRILAPTKGSQRTLTLLEYYTVPACAFHLVNMRGQLYPVQDEYNAKIHGSSVPRTAIALSLPDDDSSLERNRNTTLRSSLPPVAHFLASQLECVTDGLGSHEMSNPPSKVRLHNHFALPSSSIPPVVFFFKPGFADGGHIREAALLGRIAALRDIFSGAFRTSRLAGLVVWDDDENALMGILMEHIAGRTLTAELADGRRASLASRRKWFAQVEATVARLHAAGIVWGDVKPDNIMIDEGGNAVLVDFGGGYTPRYVPRSVHETVEGDLMGLRQIKAEMELGF